MLGISYVVEQLLASQGLSSMKLVKHSRSATQDKESEVSLPGSQEPATLPDSEPHESTPHPDTLYFKPSF
jgi:hypothetical protein